MQYYICTNVRMMVYHCITNYFSIGSENLNVIVQPLALCSSIFEPKLNVLLFQFGKLLSV